MRWLYDEHPMLAVFAIAGFWILWMGAWSLLTGHPLRHPGRAAAVLIFTGIVLGVVLVVISRAYRRPGGAARRAERDAEQMAKRLSRRRGIGPYRELGTRPPACLSDRRTASAEWFGVHPIAGWEHMGTSQKGPPGMVRGPGLGEASAMPLMLPPDEPCSFCDYLAGTGPYTILERSELTATLVTYEQRGRGHVLVIPVRHRLTVLDLSNDERNALMAGVVRATVAIVGAFDPEGVAVWQNNGIPANQSVPHVHFHVARRPPRRGNKMGGRGSAPRSIRQTSSPIG